MKRRTTEPVWLGAEALPGGLPEIGFPPVALAASSPPSRARMGAIYLRNLLRSTAHRILALAPR
jgi:hypothetical protein